ncbi:MAG TPA: amidohydrolase family protein [Vicinamibacteria bacterium]
MKRRDFLRGAILGAATSTIASSARALPAPSRATGGDLLLVNADMITLDPRRPSASAALVRSGRIVMVGDARDVRTEARNAREFDAGGRVVIPGFVDNHCHVEDSCVVGDHQPTLRAAKSISEMVVKICSVASGVPKGEWVLLQAAASDFPEKVAEKRWLNRHDLDEATAEHPVMVVLGIHASILNTSAWKRTGYWEPGSDENVKWKSDGTPRRGSFIHRDPSGHPMGLATEVWDFRPGYTVEQYKESMQRHFKEWFLSKGLTSIATIQDTAPNEFLALQELQEEGGLPVRLRVYPVVPHAIALRDVTRVGWRSGFGDERFRFGGVKLFVDGIGSDYMGRSLTDLKWTEESLTEALVSCQRGGLQAILHVVTEGGWDLAVRSLEAAKATASGELRHRIDHRTPGDDARIAKAKSLGLTLGITAPRQKPGTTPPPRRFRQGPPLSHARGPGDGNRGAGRRGTRGQLPSHAGNSEHGHRAVRRRGGSARRSGDSRGGASHVDALAGPQQLGGLRKGLHRARQARRLRSAFGGSARPFRRGNSLD